MLFCFAADINECNSDPCMNNGMCGDLVNSFSCNCTDGYNGSMCNIGMIIYNPSGLDTKLVTRFHELFLQVNNCRHSPIPAERVI